MTYAKFAKKKLHNCGAKTRAETPCKRSPMHNGRCCNHGGKSLAGAAHPNYKHGRYSKYDLDAKVEMANCRQARRTKKLIGGARLAIATAEMKKKRQLASSEILRLLRELTSR
jgi:hypothetical protein